MPRTKKPKVQIKRMKTSLGLAYAYFETDETHADEATIVENISGQYSQPLRVVAFNTAEGWACDVTEDIARAALSKAEGERRPIGRAAQEFLERTLADMPWPAKEQSVI